MQGGALDEQMAKNTDAKGDVKKKNDPTQVSSAYSVRMGRA
jgi:hypothetical protein